MLDRGYWQAGNFLKVGNVQCCDTIAEMQRCRTNEPLTIRDYLRHSNLHVTNKYLQATPESKRVAQGKLVEAILPSGVLPVGKSTLIQ
jgi:hypothetical protein